MDFCAIDIRLLPGFLRLLLGVGVLILSVIRKASCRDLQHIAFGREALSLN